MQEKYILRQENLKVELVQVLFRHGARTPVPQELNVYNYTDTSAYARWGLGALTNQGKQQEYEFGSYLRDRYTNFLSTNYKSEEIYAYSTNSERTTMSLQLVLAGLYPPKDHVIWNPDLKWSPIPYSYTPHVFDILLRPFDRLQYRQLMKEVQESEEFAVRTAKYTKFLQLVSKKTGVTLHDASKVPYLFGTIVANENMKLPLPEWYVPEIKQTFVDIMENIYYDGYAFTPKMKRLGPGFIIKKFVENMNLDGITYNPRKIYLYSGHDDNLATFIRAHDMQEFRYAPYGSGLIFEKLKDSENKVYVRILAWPGNGKFLPLKIGNHGEFCPIEDYLEIVKPIMPTDCETDAILRELAESTDLKNVLFSDPYVKTKK